MPSHTVRRSHLHLLLERYEPVEDCRDQIEAQIAQRPLPAWALVQFSSSKPREKWITLCDSAQEACSAAAYDFEWCPEVIVDLDGGTEFALRVTVTFDPANGRQLVAAGATA